MPSSTVMPVVLSPTTKTTAKVTLIAWDPESEAHAERLFQQRIACGWKSEQIEKWRALQREGKIVLQWVVLSDEDSGKETKLAQHLLKYPNEAALILDSATSLGAKPRIPSSLPFIPVGHISLDSESLDEGLADVSQGLYCITSFYISRAIQNSGLGRAAMDVLEREAVDEPLCARTLSLSTLANDSANRKEMWEKIGMSPPALSNQDWYTRRGYKVWKYVEGHIKHRDPSGKIWPLDGVLMKKTVA